MKNVLAVFVITAATLAAQASAHTGAVVRKATTAQTVVKPMTIPADAMPNPNGSYSWTDKQGKRWLFVKTPFGVMKSEAIPPPTDSTSMAGVKATDAGDTVRFEKLTPFGPVKWEKNKADLTDGERSLVASQVAPQSQKQE